MFDIDTVCANSFRNFHVKDFDYLCLSRTPELTRKVYFFEGNLDKLPEIVMPHDHRYPFTTTVLSGGVHNTTYSKMRGNFSRLYNQFSYLTPLNGGDGFEWIGEVELYEVSRLGYTRGRHYHSEHNDIHTLNIRCEGTVIMLEQLADVVPLTQATSSYCLADSREGPCLDGLYDRMTADHAVKRINQFLDLVGNRR